jgi:hypothetical protein
MCKGVKTYSRYVDKLKHIIDDACYYVFHYYNDEKNGLNTNFRNATQFL